MSAATGNPAAPMLRRLPFSVRLAPSFLTRLATLKAPDDQNLTVHGVLFGTLEPNAVTVRVAQPFPGGLDDAALEAFLLLARKDAGNTGVTPVGWYAVRPTGGLLSRDIATHTRHFPRTSDLAVILRHDRSPGSTRLEVFCRAINGELSAGSHRSGIALLPSDARFESPVEVAIRPYIHDDLYLNAYSSGDVVGPAANRWRRVAQRLLLVLIFIAALLITYFVTSYLNRPRPGNAALTDHPLGVHLERRGRQIVVLWNRTAAAQGKLSIHDGSLRQEFPLDRRQLKAGYFTYTPSSSSLTVRLTLSAGDGSETAEVLHLSPAPGLKPVSQVEVEAAPPEMQPATPPAESPLTETPPESSTAAPLESAAPDLPANLPAKPQRVMPRVHPPAPLQQVLPDTSRIPASLLASPKQVTVLVRVEADGHVARAEALRVTAANSGLVTAALAAAKQWTFQPATLGGKAVPGQHTIIFKFQSRPR